MKRINLLILCLLCTVIVFGQEKETTISEKKQKKKQALSKPVLFKDRIVLDLFSSIWYGLESDVIKQKPINIGFNGAFMFDLPVKKNSPFSFGLGLGVTNHNLYSNAIWGIGSEYTTTMTPVPTGIKYRQNKITFTNINIPLEFRYRHSSGFKISAGVRIGLMADIHSKYFGAALDGSEDKDLFKNYNIPNRTNIPVELTFKSGWKFVSFNFSYMITKMFVDKSPQINTMSFGVTLCPY